MKTLFVILSYILLVSQNIFAQSADSLKLTLPQAEQQFIQKNYFLLAQKYNIDAANAAIIQAKLLPNPVVNYEQTVITRTTVANDAKIGPLGQRALQIQQLIQVAGKRNKQVVLAKIGVEISEYQFSEIIRELLFQLRSNFYQIHFLQNTYNMYDQEIQNISNLVIAYQNEVQKGNIPQKEFIRLQSFLITLQTEKNNIYNQIIDSQEVVKILLADNSTNIIEPIIDGNQIKNINLESLKLANLIDDAMQNRPDFKIQEASTRLAEANLNLQKALAKPDVVVGYSYDRAGSYVNNYHALTVSMPLPFFNKNQGNIKIAESQIQANKKYLGQTQNQLENEVLQAFLKAQESESLFRKIDVKFQPDFEKLIGGVLENYQKRNLTLIEFTDFLESYKNSINQLNTLQNNRMQAFENLNFVIGKKVI